MEITMIDIIIMFILFIIYAYSGGFVNTIITKIEIRRFKRALREQKDVLSKKSGLKDEQLNQTYEFIINSGYLDSQYVNSLETNYSNDIMLLRHEIYIIDVGCIKYYKAYVVKGITKRSREEEVLLDVYIDWQI